MFNLQAAHREPVLCVLPFILSMRSPKRSIVGKPVQFHGSDKYRKAIYTGKHRRSMETLLTVLGFPLKTNSVAIAMENKPQSIVLFC